MSHRHILAIDLSSAYGQIAIIYGKDVLFEAAFQSERSHNAQLFGPLQEALETVRMKEAVIVVGTGPGSYTGVRIAIAAAQGISLSRGWPVMGWPTITAAAHEAVDYRVLGDARRGMFYTSAVRQGRMVEKIELLSEEAARKRVAENSDLPWVTVDAKVPLGLENVALARPSALRLAQIVETLTDAEIVAGTASLLEPLYLQDAFITVAKKAGKHVPAASVVEPAA